MAGRVVRLASSCSLLLTALWPATPSAAEKKYDPGVSDTEIRIGNIMPYSGPVSAYGVIGKVEAAYFSKINAEGGINGRKINFISYDDSGSPPKTVEQARKLVESDEVFLLFGPLGTAQSSAIHKYMNGKKVPLLFVASGAVKWGDPKRFPWTMGWRPTYQTEGRVYARHILDNRPNGKIAVLYQNDDFGKDLLKGLKDGLGDKASMIVASETFELTDPTIDGRVASLKASGADVYVCMASPKFTAQSLKKVKELNWTPMHFISSTSSSIGSTIKPAGFENAQGVMSVSFLKDVTDLQWKDDPGVKEYDTFLQQWYPAADRIDSNVAYGMMAAQSLVQVLKMSGDRLTRENVMKQAASLKDFELGLLLPGIKVNTSPDDFFPVEQEQLMRFEGENWHLIGDVITGEARLENSQ
ncbi:ABC transporter substrate-binding protein [Bradyrhizobium sp. CCGUVB1N3]|uniref:ABC transporter substrate-binding protein n=1 Tax=Bradyrhizobium sp. CCGUVB1N3 TaxID=2949629 RepID=UPI0020B36A7B|nr:ABC transporter substrate-binding protein [Bradyrhizobium sp. CCGUVB1N3]MCP3476758.1 ABC transporter substrate-binding protein [Bradyrhizobium sp. CCGUVB1N3]